MSKLSLQELYERSIFKRQVELKFGNTDIKQLDENRASIMSSGMLVGNLNWYGRETSYETTQYHGVSTIHNDNRTISLVLNVNNQKREDFHELVPFDINPSAEEPLSAHYLSNLTLGELLYVTSASVHSPLIANVNVLLATELPYQGEFIYKPLDRLFTNDQLAGESWLKDRITSIHYEKTWFFDLSPDKIQDMFIKLNVNNEGHVIGDCKTYACLAVRYYREHGLPSRLRAATSLQSMKSDHLTLEIWNGLDWKTRDPQEIVSQNSKQTFFNVEPPKGNLRTFDLFYRQIIEDMQKMSLKQ